MKIAFTEIDYKIENAFRLRYSDPEESMKLSIHGLTDSIQMKYSRGIAYAKLNLGISAFLKSQTEEAFNQIRDSLEYFHENESETGYGKALNALGNLYESIGDYENGLAYCMQALKLAKERKDR